MEHKLYYEWKFWLDGLNNKSSEQYGDKILEIGTFSSVETFWGIFDSLPQLSTIEMGNDVCMFKSSIKPLWEDKGNLGGGKLQFVFDDTNKDKLQIVWRDLVCSFS